MLNWQVDIPGKWILAGEHAVLRDSPAVVFPLKSKYLRFSYFDEMSDFKLQLEGISASDLEMIIWSVFEKALQEIGVKRSDLKGTLKIESHIQFGAGMGASATLAVGMALFFQKMGFLNSDLFLFAKKIEDMFHGESSGVDVAVALHQKPLLFVRNKEINFISVEKLPQLYLSYSGLRGVTKDCVNKVKELMQVNPDKVKTADQHMKEVVQSYIDSNFNWSKAEWIANLNKAQMSFEAWGLVPAEVRSHIEQLKKSGALACKLTGSGQGGFVLSYWESEPNEDIKADLIPVFL